MIEHRTGPDGRVYPIGSARYRADYWPVVGLALMFASAVLVVWGVVTMIGWWAS